MRQYIHGKNVIERRLVEGKEIERLYLVENTNHHIAKLAKEKGVLIERVKRKEMDKMVKANHQNVIAEINFYQTYSLDSILNSIGDSSLLVMLDGVQDPQNFGAILRTCAAVGVDGVIVRKDRAAPLNATVAKASAGAIERVQVAPVVNLSRAIDQLKKEGFWIVGATLEEAQDYRTVDYDGRIVIVVGSEGDGLSRLVESKCDFKAKIPMVNELESLNVSVATAIMLYEAYGQRNPL